MSYHPAHEKRALMHANEPGFRATALRHAPVLEEFVTDLGAGREVVFLVIPPPRPVCFCAVCWGAGRIMEPGPLGLMAVLCPTCEGRRTA